MKLPPSYSDKKILIIDDLPEMRSSLRSQVGTLGCEKISICGTVRDALELCRQNRFDVILCDYYLGGGTDGQQFLEFIRSRSLISRSALFIMVTAEKGYEGVVTAAECLPDEYLLKPFTAETLKLRLERLLEKKNRLAKIDALQDKERWSEVVTACDAIIAARDRYLIDAMRIKGNALVMAGRAQEAIPFYEQVLAMRFMPWAKLGLARALHQAGEVERCRTTLDALLIESPQLMSAYDLLGRLHLESGDADAALSVLDEASRISPNSLARHRAIATVAEEKKDFSRVEQALDLVVKKTRNSPLRETGDIAKLGNALTELGDPAKAVALLEDARTNFKSDADNPLLAAVEAVAQHKAGNSEKAAEALARAMKGDVSKLPEAAAMAVAKACLTTGQQDKAEQILKSVVQSNPDSKAVQARVTAVMRENGAEGRAEHLVAESVREIIQLNNEAVKRGKAGDLSAAAAMLTEAAHRLPNNLQIVANAAYALLADVFTNGLDAGKLRDAQTFSQGVQAQNPQYPKLADIAELSARVRTKYGLSGGG
jgi:tetratricopeptide (TPR) repeat protein